MTLVLGMAMVIAFVETLRSVVSIYRTIETGR